MDRTTLMNTFVAVVNEGSFTKAADRLHISNQLVSKYIAQLETHLNVRLFNRTTRKVHLTEAGEQCFQYAKHILESISDMEGHFSNLQSRAHGLLRISAPASFSTLHLAPLIRDFQRTHTEVGIDLELNDRKVDVIEEGYDVALRIGNLKSSSLIAKYIAPVRLVVCASPDYLAKHGTPTHPTQLNPDHHLRYGYMEYNQPHSPLIDALKRGYREQHAGLVCNNGEILVEAAIAGEGYVFQPTFIVGEAIKQGKLKIILQEFESNAMALYAVYPHRKLLTSKLSAFIDFLSGYYGEPPYWDAFE